MLHFDKAVANHYAYYQEPCGSPDTWCALQIVWHRHFLCQFVLFLIVEVQAVNDTPTVIGINRTQDGSISVIKGTP